MAWTEGEAAKAEMSKSQERLEHLRWYLVSHKLAAKGRKLLRSVLLHWRRVQADDIAAQKEALRASQRAQVRASARVVCLPLQPFLLTPPGVVQLETAVLLLQSKLATAEESVDATLSRAFRRMAGHKLVKPPG